MFEYETTQLTIWETRHFKHDVRSFSGCSVSINCMLNRFVFFLHWTEMNMTNYLQMMNLCWKSIQRYHHYLWYWCHICV